MVEKNTENKKTENNEDNTKKHRWLGVIIIILLLLFIGTAGYYLEIDLKPLSDINDSENGELNNGKDEGIIEKILKSIGLNDSEFNKNLNILLLGLDDKDSVALGTIEADSIVFAALKADKNLLQLEYIDEDQIYKGQTLKKHSREKINSAIVEITDKAIDYHLYIDYRGFEKVVDELGGVQINIDQNLKIEALGLDLKAGKNLLSGREALNFVRWKSSNYLSRAKRQKMIITAVMDKLRKTSVNFNIKKLYNSVVESYRSVETNIPPVLAAEILNYLRTNDKFQLEFVD